MPGLGDMEKQQYRTALEQKEAINPAKDERQPMPDAKQAVLKPDGGETTPSSRPANGEAFTNVLNQTAQGAGANGNAASVTQAMPDWDIAQQIVQKATLITQQGKSMMEIQLKPEFLGKVKVQLAFSEGAVSAYLTAEKSQVSQLLGSMLQQIKTSLEDQGIRIDYLGVNVGDQNDEAGDFKNDDTRQNLYQYQAPHDLAEESPEEAIGGLYEVDYLA